MVQRGYTNQVSIEETGKQKHKTAPENKGKLCIAIRNDNVTATIGTPNTERYTALNLHLTTVDI